MVAINSLNDVIAAASCRGSGEAGISREDETFIYAITC